MTTTDGQTLTGRIVGSADDASDARRRRRRAAHLAYADVAKALVQVEFNRQTKPDDEED